MARTPALVDHRGRPIERRLLPRELTRPTVAGVRPVLTAHPVTGLTPERLAALLREAEQPGGAERYLELAEEMEERDLHYLGVLQTRKRQVGQIGVTIEPADDSAEAEADAELARLFFHREQVVDELYDVMDALGKGFSVTEIVWETSERQWMPARLEARLPQWFDFDQDTGSRLVRRPDDAGGDWVELEPWKYVAHVTKVKSGLPIRGGLARVAGWAWFFKNLALKDWARFCEAYGMPVRVGKYGHDATPEDRRTLLRAVANVVPDLAAIIPAEMEIEFVDDHTVRGRSEIYRDFVAYIDQQISIAVLGQTLTTKEGDHSGSYALGQVHNNVRHDIETDDGRQLAATLRRDLVIPIVQLNHGVRDAYPKVVIERAEAADVEVLTNAAEKLVPLGLRIKTDSFYERLGIERPGEGDEVLEPARPADEDGEAATRARRRGLLAILRAAEDDDAIDAAVDGALDDWRPLLDPVVSPLLAAAREELAGGGGLASFRRRLPGLIEAMDDDAVASMLEQLSFSARVSERGDPGA